MERIDGRKPDELRKLKITRPYLDFAEGSLLIELGKTRIICTASVEEKVPPFLKGTGQGWITAEYAMLPRSTGVRSPRESSIGKIGGRTHEIHRLIGRSLRSVVDLRSLGELTVWMDCDVIQADGGTRTAAVTGSFIALYDALEFLTKQGRLTEMPLTEFVAATSVGIVDGERLLDLCYEEDATAQVDMNVIMTGSGKIIEIQGTAESHPFSKKEMDDLLSLAEKGISKLVSIQRKTIGGDIAGAR
jgi:ribonuclease PH